VRIHVRKNHMEFCSRRGIPAADAHEPVPHAGHHACSIARKCFQIVSRAAFGISAFPIVSAAHETPRPE
jgi:hypothetical protein